MTLLRSRPLAQKSEKAKARDGVLSRTKRAVLRRCFGRCEVCGKRDERLDLHHVYSRSGLGVWNDSAECCAAVCRPCHADLTDGRKPGENAGLRAFATGRLASRYEEVTGTAFYASGELDSLQVARLIVAELERLGEAP